MKFYREKMKKFRERAGLTHAEVALPLSVQKQSVEHWEAGRAKPLPARVPALAKVLNCRVSDISDIMDEPPSHDSYSVLDDQLSFIVENWGYLTALHRAEVFGFVKGLTHKNGGK